MGWAYCGVEGPNGNGVPGGMKSTSKSILLCNFSAGANHVMLILVPVRGEWLGGSVRLPGMPNNK